MTSPLDPMTQATAAIQAAALTDTLTGAQKAAAILTEWRQTVAALVSLRAYTWGQSHAVTRLISLAAAMESICAVQHSRLMDGTQDDWKSELPTGKAPEFRRLLREFMREVRRLAHDDSTPDGQRPH